MKTLTVKVEIFGLLNQDVEEADFSIIREFKIDNFKIALGDIIAQCSYRALLSDYPSYEYVGFEVLSYS
jgi:hypothetical protein